MSKANDGKPDLLLDEIALPESFIVCTRKICFQHNCVITYIKLGREVRRLYHGHKWVKNLDKRHLVMLIHRFSCEFKMCPVAGCWEQANKAVGGEDRYSRRKKPHATT